MSGLAETSSPDHSSTPPPGYLKPRAIAAKCLPGGGDRTRTTLWESRAFKDDRRIEEGPETESFRPFPHVITWAESSADRSVSFWIATVDGTGSRPEKGGGPIAGRLHRPCLGMRSED